MRYYINFDKIINQLVPFYIRGRKLILYLQALIHPLRALNDKFVEYAKETRIEATMTSQIIKLEWYLNRKFSKYFADGGKIYIRSVDYPLGTPIYNESASVPKEDNILLYGEEEKDKKKQLILYRSNEYSQEGSVSFYVVTPRIDTKLIAESKYLAMLKYVIDRYRIANKTYYIQYES